VRSFDPARALLLVAVAAFFAALGWVLFKLGLRNYSSGSIWTR
jgi:hypothetical protein